MDKDKYGIPLDKPWRDVRFNDDDGTPMNLMDWQAKMQSELGFLRIDVMMSLKHIDTPFHWCGLTSHQHAAVYWHVRGKSARAIGEIMGKSRYTVWGYLRQAVKKINDAEDWDIKIVDLPDMLLRLIKEDLDGEEKSRQSSSTDNRTTR